MCSGDGGEGWSADAGQAGLRFGNFFTSGAMYSVDLSLRVTRENIKSKERQDPRGIALRIGM